MSRPDRRRSPRVPVWLRTRLRIGNREAEVFTGEVGLRGAYVVTDAKTHPKQLLTVTMVLPDGHPLEMNAMAIRAVPPEDALKRGVPPGVGVHFYGLSAETRERWEKAFFAMLTERSPRTSPAPEDMFDPAPLATSGAEKPAPKKATPSLVIVPESDAEPPGPRQEPAARRSPPARHEKPQLLVAEQPEPPGPGASNAPTPDARSADGADEGEPEPGSSQWDTWFEYFHGQTITGKRGRPASAAPQGADRGVLPDDGPAPIVYRVALPTVVALRGLAGQARATGGMEVRGARPAAVGTPVVVCLVHPMSGDELHLPGEVAPWVGASETLNVRLQGPIEATIASIERFAEFGASESDAATRRDADVGADEDEAPVTLIRPSRPGERPSRAEDVIELSESDFQVIDDDDLV